ncbi:MAG: RidA family protein [Chloroflexi bacterium]|nr:RidA family protein [Chloroflexota bacterium]
MADRSSINVPGRAHRGGAIPMGSKIGNVVYSSGIGAGDPNGGERPKDLDKQAENMFKNMEGFMALAGGTVDDIIFVMLLLKDRGTREYVDKHWLLTFPDADSRPARHALQTELGGGQDMQALITAVIS